MNYGRFLIFYDDDGMALSVMDDFGNLVAIDCDAVNVFFYCGGRDSH